MPEKQICVLNSYVCIYIYMYICDIYLPVTCRYIFTIFIILKLIQTANGGTAFILFLSDLQIGIYLTLYNNIYVSNIVVFSTDRSQRWSEVKCFAQGHPWYNVEWSPTQRLHCAASQMLKST
jgi:hypothetical protein